MRDCEAAVSTMVAFATWIRTVTKEYDVIQTKEYEAGLAQEKSVHTWYTWLIQKVDEVDLPMELRLFPLSAAMLRARTDSIGFDIELEVDVGMFVGMSFSLDSKNSKTITLYNCVIQTKKVYMEVDVAYTKPAGAFRWSDLFPYNAQILPRGSKDFQGACDDLDDIEHVMSGVRLYMDTAALKQDIQRRLMM
jgi:hypothetical protein